MFDAIDPRIFWPLFMLFWLVSGFAVAAFLGRLVDRTNPRNRNRFELSDRIAERKRRIAASGYRQSYRRDS